MALFIQFTNSIGVSRGVQWHYGEPLPSDALRARVVVFQADGDELDLILHALKATRPVPTIKAEVVEDRKLEADNENPRG